MRPGCPPTLGMPPLPLMRLQAVGVPRGILHCDGSVASSTGFQPNENLSQLVYTLVRIIWNRLHRDGLLSALVYPLRVPEREVRGTVHILLPPHPHPAFSAGSLFITASKTPQRATVPGETKAFGKQRPSFPTDVNFKFMFVFAPLVPQCQLVKIFAVRQAETG